MVSIFSDGKSGHYFGRDSRIERFRTRALNGAPARKLGGGKSVQSRNMCNVRHGTTGGPDLARHENFAAAWRLLRQIRGWVCGCAQRKGMALGKSGPITGSCNG